MQSPLPLLIAALMVAAITLLPVVYLAVRTAGAWPEAAELLLRGRTAAILTRTAVLIVVVNAGALAIAVPIAWLTVRTDLPLRRFWSVVAVLPLVVPSFVAGMIAVAALGPFGLLQGLLERLFGVERLPSIYGLPGAALVLTLLTYPYVLLTVQASMRRLDPSLEEAARALGHGPIRAFMKVTLPLLRPSIGAGAVLVALYTLSDFGAVSLLRYETFTWAIFTQYEAGFDRDLASALSLALVVVALAILVVDIPLRGKGRYYRSAAGAVRPPPLAQLGAWRWPATAFVSTTVAVALAIPLCILGFWVIRGAITGETLGLSVSVIWNSVRAAAFAAASATGAAVPVALLAVRYRGRVSALIERVTYIGFALPGIVIALAVVFFGVNYLGPLYQTLGLLVAAYVILFVPTAIGSVRSSLMQVNPRLEEAARTLGEPPWRVWVRVTLPLVLPGVFAGAAMVFLLTMKELPATLILSPIGFKTLATSIWSAASEAFFARAAAPALALIAASGIPMAYLMLRDVRFTSHRESKDQAPAAAIKGDDAGR